MSSVVPDAQVSSKRAAVAAAKQPDAHSGLPWEPAVSEAVLGFAHGDARIVQMVREKVVLLAWSEKFKTSFAGH